MDGYDFVNRNLKIPRLPLRWKTKKTMPIGECEACERKGLELGESGVCIDCYQLRCARPCISAKEMRIGTASDIVFVSENNTKIWTNLFQQDTFPKAEIFPADGPSKTELFRSLVMEPPEGDYVVMNFERSSPDPATIRVNYDRNYLLFSLNPFVITKFTRESGKQTLAINRVDSGRVRDMLETYPLATKEEWDSIISLKESCRKSQTAKLAVLRERMMLVFRDLPRKNSQEHHALYYLGKEEQK